MSISKIQKRNGVIVDFEAVKIQNSVQKAFDSLDEAGGQVEAEVLTKDIIVSLVTLYENDIPTVEDVQDIVEDTLMDCGYHDVAKAYVLYREKRSVARKDRGVVVEVDKTISEYLKKLDWRVHANSNQGYSLGGMILNTAGKVTANYWLSHIYPKSIGDAHRNADLHIHDLDMFSGYCAGWSLRALLEEGFNGVENKIESNPPKHLGSAVAQMVNFLGTLQNEWAGAQAFSSFDTYLAPFVKKYSLKLEQDIESFGMAFDSPEKKQKYVEEKTYEYVHQNIQSFVFNLNIPSRWGTQTPFTNITLDLVCPEDLKGKRLTLAGEPFEYTFDELQHEMFLVNKAYIEVMSAGDAKGRTFTFPIPTYNVGKDFDWEDDTLLPLFEMTAKYGTPYFQNFINSDLNPGDVRSMCCRLQLDLTELKKRGGGLFGSAEMTGSIGVVTINAARIGYVHRGDKKGFFNQLQHLMKLAKISLEIKRKEVSRWLGAGLFPYTKRYLPSFRNHFSTIGVNGINEAVRNFTDDIEDITSENGRIFAEEILDFMRNELAEYQEETGHLYNLEATPAEGTTYRFAKEDQKKFPTIIQAGTEKNPYYTNSSQLPVGYTDDVFEALDNQDNLQTKYTGGTVLHCYMNERISSGKACRSLVRNILSNYRLPYITITPTFSICPNHGYLAGEHDFCPKCDAEIGYVGESVNRSEHSEFIEKNKQ